MKIKEGFTLRSIADTWIVIPTGSTMQKFTDMLNLNDSGALIWKMLEKDVTKEDLVNMMITEYEIDKDTVSNDIDEILTIFNEKGLLLSDSIVK